MHKWDMTLGATILLGGFALLFAMQTAELIWELYTEETWWMKVLLVFTIDGFCAIWYYSKLFYAFKNERNYRKAVWMFNISFGISAACSVIQMNLFMDTRMHVSIDPHWLVGAFWVITGCFILNLVALSSIVETEREVPKASPSIKKN